MDILPQNRKGFLRREVEKLAKAENWDGSLFHPDPQFKTLLDNQMATSLWLSSIGKLNKYHLSRDEKNLIFFWCKCVVCSSSKTTAKMAKFATKPPQRKRTLTEIRLGLQLPDLEGVA